MKILKIAIVFFICSAGISSGKPPAQQDVINVLERMSGDWIGTFTQSTDKVKGISKYFQATVAQTSPDSYKTTFKYYTLDPATGNLADAGTSSMTTTIAPDGTGTNMMIGEGEVVMDDAGDPKWEQHQFSEILALASPDTLQGSGIGTVVVSKSAEEEGGQKGKIVKYASTWEVNDSQWKITQQFQVKFKAFVFRKTYTITMNHEVRKGSDIMDLFKDADGKVNLENSAK